MLAANSGELDKALQVVGVNRRRLNLLGGDDVYTPKTLEIGGQSVEGMVLAVPWHINANPTSAFPRQSRRLWGADVNWRSALSYDATRAIIAALESSPTRTGVQQALASSDFSATGASGTIRFLASGDRNAPVQLVKIVSWQSFWYWIRLCTNTTIAPVLSLIMLLNQSIKKTAYFSRQ